MTYLILLVLFVFACNQKENLSLRLKCSAKELLAVREITDFKTNNNKPTGDIVNIGKGLYQLLKKNKNETKHYKILVSEGDLFNDNNVSHSIQYINAKNHTKLMIRIRYDNKKDKFHIVG